MSSKFRIKPGSNTTKTSNVRVKNGVRSKSVRIKSESARLKNLIPKGGSSSCNPTSKRFREAAKTERLIKQIPLISVDELVENANSNFVNGNKDQEDYIEELPVQNINLENGQSEIEEGNDLEDRMGDDSDFKEEGDATSNFCLSVATKTEFSNFTSCTNPTFDAVHREWKSGSKLHGEVVAVLAAVAEIIRQNQGTESDVEYFAALLTCLESASIKECQKIAAIAYLLHLNVKKVAKPILINYFSQATKIICEKLSQIEINDFSTTALKFLISTVGTILSAQSASTWQYSSNNNILTIILKFASEDQAWVRTMSRRVMRNLLTDPLRCSENGFHPAAKFVGEIILQGLKTPLAHKQQKTFIARLLCLLEGILHKLPKSISRPLAEEILHLGSVADRVVKCAAFQCLQRALLQQPNDSCLSTETNTQLIVALRTLKAPRDICVCAYWLKALVEAHVCLAGREESKSVDLLSETLKICAELFERDADEIFETLHAGATRLIQCSIQQNGQAAQLFLSYLDEALQQAAKRHAATAFKWVLKTMKVLFEESQTMVVGESFTRVLREMAKLRDREKCFCEVEIDELFGSAIHHVGLQPVLDVVPLNLDANAPQLSTDFARSWLLVVVQHNLHNASIDYFTNYFLPLAVTIYERLGELRELHAKLYTAIQAQIWSILPKILNSNPTDFDDAFPRLCQVLGAALNERADLRLIVLAAIRGALNFASSNSPTSRQIMARYSKNFLPIFFSIYTSAGDSSTLSNTPLNGTNHLLSTSEQGIKLALLETIRLYLSSTPKELLSTYVQIAIERVQNDENSLQKKALIMDILIAMSREADLEALKEINNALPIWLVSQHSQMQKKGYRLLAEIYQRINDVTLKDFFTSNMSQIEELIKGGVNGPGPKVTPSAWSSRIAIYRSIVNSLEDFAVLCQFCESITQEMFMFLDRDNSKPTRTQASKLLQEICVALIRLGIENDEPPSSVLGPLLEHTFSSANTTTIELSNKDGKAAKTMRCHLLTLNIVIQKHLRHMNASLLSRLVAYATTTIAVDCATIRVLAIRLMRLLCGGLPSYALAQYKELLLNAIFVAQSPKNLTGRIRKANAQLFDTLLDKFGSETVLSYAQNRIGWVKQLKNLEKCRRRRVARKQLAKSGRKSAGSLENGEDAMEAEGDVIEDEEDDEEQEEEEVSDIFIK